MGKHASAGAAGQVLPEPGDWQIDSQASTVAFCGRASRIAPTVRARFQDVHGELHLADDPERSSVEVDLDVRSLTTGNAVWDDMLRVADPFHVGSHPHARYVSSRVRWDGRSFTVEGQLHLGGARISLTLTATITTSGDDVHLEATGTIDPKAAGIRLNVPGASLLVPRAMTLTIAINALRAAPGARPRPADYALAS
jgi:polyisoprenoid-binding protein YceI